MCGTLSDRSFCPRRFEVAFFKFMAGHFHFFQLRRLWGMYFQYSQPVRRHKPTSGNLKYWRIRLLALVKPVCHSFLFGITMRVRKSVSGKVCAESQCERSPRFVLKGGSNVSSSLLSCRGVLFFFFTVCCGVGWCFGWVLTF